MVTEIKHNGETLAIVIPHDYSEPGIGFFTPNHFSQQLAYMQHSVGRIIPPHVHNPVPRQVSYTQEALFIRKGRVRVDFYDRQQVYIESRILQAGDVILLATGGHGFEILEDLEMIEVKQGPYAGETDKTRFTGISAAQVRIGG